MSSTLRRDLADLSCRMLHAILPPSLGSWGLAIRRQTADIADDTQALLFALDSVCGVIPRAIASLLFRPLAPLIGEAALFNGSPILADIYGAALRRPRAIGMGCVIGAVALGLIHMAITAAPARYLGVNTGALAVGLTAVVLIGRAVVGRPRWVGVAILATAAALLATALLGDQAGGAARWVNLVGLPIQPDLILLPVTLVAFARTRSVVATVGVIGAAVALALQPDRAMAGMLALGLSVLVIARRDRHVIPALAISVAGFATTLVRADDLPAAPYVSQVFSTAFDVHAAAGMAVLAGSALLFVPALAGWTRDPANRTIYAVFGAAWLAVIVAAALGDAPTPIVGYGGSAILGYALSLLALPARAETAAGTDLPISKARAVKPLDQPIHFELA